MDRRAAAIFEEGAIASQLGGKTRTGAQVSDERDTGPCPSDVAVMIQTAIMLVELVFTILVAVAIL